MTTPRIVLAVDPGNNTGIAWFLDGKLIACYLAEPGDKLVVPASFGDGSLGVAHAVFELPKFYPVHSYGDPKKATRIGNSLIRESVTLGEWKYQARALGCTLEEVLPRTWKGSAPKATMLKKIVKHMTRDERRLVLALGLPKSTVHNVLDAIGIGLWSVGRLEDRRFQ